MRKRLGLYSKKIKFKNKLYFSVEFYSEIYEGGKISNMYMYMSIVGIIIILLPFLYNKDNKRNQNIFIILVGILLIYVSSVRSSNVGNDTETYLNIFSYANNTSLDAILFGPQGADRGYLIYNRIIGSIMGTDNRIILHLFNSSIITFGFMYFIKKNSSSIAMSVLLYITLYYFGASLNIQRQFIALCLFFIAFEYMKKNKVLIPVLLILFASLFHASAIILLLVIFLFKIKPTPKNLIRIGVLATLVSLVVYVQPSIILQFSSQYSRYIGTDFFDSVGVGGTMVLWVIKLSLSICGFLILRQRNNNLNPNVRRRIFISSIMVFISIMFEIIGTRLSLLFRLAYYFDIFLLLLIPDIAKYMFKETKTVNLIAFVLSFVYFLFRLYTLTDGVVPYEFIWR